MDVAERYYRKAVGILGEANVVVRARLDPRAPAGPAKVFVQERFAFPSGSAVVDDRYKSLLDLGVIALQRIPEAMLVITGYTDNVGPADLNQRLSEMRAQVVVDYMVARGIPADRVIAVGKGESAPVADNRTPEGRAENRRIEGVLIGIMP
ncbi:MAG: OmpA family protein [Actinobacteria bacterium]|nr:OmpA family protein [Actinomycetota bacterium]